MTPSAPDPLTATFAALADPLKGWGDALAREGRWSEAVAKYDEALKNAPAWTALRQARATAARRAG